MNLTVVVIQNATTTRLGSDSVLAVGANMPFIHFDTLLCNRSARCIGRRIEAQLYAESAIAQHPPDVGSDGSWHTLQVHATCHTLENHSANVTRLV